MKVPVGLVLIGFGCLTGCYKTTYTRGPAQPLTKENPNYHHIVISLVEVSKPIPVHSMCEAGMNRVDLRGNFLTGMAGVLTNGLYSPEMVFVQCERPIIPQKVADTP